MQGRRILTAFSWRTVWRRGGQKANGARQDGPAESQNLMGWMPVPADNYIRQY
jgi:hypothetical protein